MFDNCRIQQVRPHRARRARDEDSLAQCIAVARALQGQKAVSSAAQSSSAGSFSSASEKVISPSTGTSRRMTDLDSPGRTAVV